MPFVDIDRLLSTLLLFTSMFLSLRFEPIFSLSMTMAPTDSFCSMAIEFVTSMLHTSPLFDHGFISVVGSTPMSSLVNSTHEGSTHTSSAVCVLVVIVIAIISLLLFHGCTGRLRQRL